MPSERLERSWFWRKRLKRKRIAYRLPNFKQRTKRAESAESIVLIIMIDPMGRAV